MTPDLFTPELTYTFSRSSGINVIGVFSHCMCMKYAALLYLNCNLRTEFRKSRATNERNERNESRASQDPLVAFSPPLPFSAQQTSNYNYTCILVFIFFFIFIFIFLFLRSNQLSSDLFLRSSSFFFPPVPPFFSRAFYL